MKSTREQLERRIAPRIVFGMILCLAAPCFAFAKPWWVFAGLLALGVTGIILAVSVTVELIGRIQEDQP